MHVVAKKKFQDAASQYPKYAAAIMETYRILDKNTFSNVHELKAVFKSVERFKYVDDAYVVDIAGNNIRLLAIVFFSSNKMFVRHVVDHKGYDRITEQCRNGGSL